MTDDIDLVAEHWPHLAALVGTLDALDGREISVTQDVQGIIEALAAHEKRGGAVPWK